MGISGKEQGVKSWESLIRVKHNSEGNENSGVSFRAAG